MRGIYLIRTHYEGHVNGGDHICVRIVAMALLLVPSVSDVSVIT